MDLYPEPIERLIGKLSKLPSIGRRSAERLALKLVSSDLEEIEELRQALSDIKTKVHKCNKCGNLTDKEICDICSNDRRNNRIVCVVEDTPNLIAIEKSKEYRGVYHVLNGLISPLNDVQADNINLDSLLERVDSGEFEEVILAISPTIEGEMTTLFLAELLKDKNVKVTRIASGIPIGGNIEYFDSETLYKALEDRREL
ncbi:recombination mediator RecR [Microaceticoccus formicicus]|uniref:recombination mediator RecR n=1 Tax=Microaceticoccus formicicus TaxID=3118105 RepID=UPI003CD02364|nr:recombination mediator RecR [Peptoniphilaceae bacterium AMB_02]